LIKDDLNEWGRYRSTSERGFNEDVMASRDRVDSGGKVDRDRKASDDAPTGYRIMKRLYLLISSGHQTGWCGETHLAHVRSGMSTPRRAHS
jgi:hypothetical protein